MSVFEKKFKKISKNFKKQNWAVSQGVWKSGSKNVILTENWLFWSKISLSRRLFRSKMTKIQTCKAKADHLIHFNGRTPTKNHQFWPKMVKTPRMKGKWVFDGNLLVHFGLFFFKNLQLFDFSSVLLRFDFNFSGNRSDFI